MNHTTMSKSDCSKVKEMILKGETDIKEISEEDLNIFIDYLLETFDPDSCSDTALLEQCYTVLESYNTVDMDSYVSSKEYRMMAQNTIESYNQYSKRFTTKRKIILIAAIISALILTGCTIAEILGFGVISLGKDLLNLEPDESIIQGNVEIVRTDEYCSYNSLEELILTEKLPQIYPANIPEEFTLQTIESIVIKDKKRIYISYVTTENAYINVSIFEELQEPESGDPIYINEIPIYIIPLESSWQASWKYNDLMYSIQCSDKNILLKLINDLKEY